MAVAQTYTITDSGSHIVITHSGGDVRNIPKSNLTIVQKPNKNNEGKVYLNWPSGDYPAALDNLYLDYTEVSAPTLASNAALAALLLSLAQDVDINVDVTSSSNSGGFYVGKSAAATGEDFVVAWASASTLTLSAYPAGISGMTATDIEVVRQISTAGLVTKTWSRDDTTMSITTNTLTVTGAAFVNTDTFVIFTNIPRTASSGAGGAGGGSIVYTNAAGDFTAAPGDGNKTVTVTGLAYTPENIHVAGGSIKRIDTNDKVTNVILTDIAVAGDPPVITLADAADNFALTDTLLVTLLGPDKWYDQAQDSAKQLVQNPEWAHYTDVEHIIDDSDATVDQHYSPEIFMAGYRNIIFQFTATCTTGAVGVVFKTWGTLNPSAATPADLDAAPSADWVDFSDDIIGAATITLGTAASESGVYFGDGETLMVHKFIVQYDPGHATNENDIFIRRH